MNTTSKIKQVNIELLKKSVKNNSNNNKQKYYFNSELNLLSNEQIKVILKDNNLKEIKEINFIHVKNSNFDKVYRKKLRNYSKNLLISINDNNYQKKDI